MKCLNNKKTIRILLNGETFYPINTSVWSDNSIMFRCLYNSELIIVLSNSDNTAVVSLLSYLNIGNKLISVCRLMIDKISRADYALLVKALPKIYQGLLFYNYDHNVTAEDYTSGWSENKWEEYLEAFETLKQEIIESD